MLIHRQAVNQPSTFTKGEIKMIEITTTTIDASGNQGPDSQEIATGITFSPASGTIITTDGIQSLQIRITPDA